MLTMLAVAKCDTKRVERALFQKRIYLANGSKEAILLHMKSATSNKNNELSRVRDTVESVYIAIVLAFVLRAFLVEAFVIPTGSMANSLYGEYYELECPCCHYEYAHGRSAIQARPDRRVVGNGWLPYDARCPNCSYPYKGDKATPVRLRGGDRVIVLKYIYDFAPPKAWDVVVFKNPQNNRENFIKRLIGLPGETIEIVRGDVFYQAKGDDTWRIKRKPLAAQEAMWQNVFTNDDRPDKEMLNELGIEQPGWQLGQNGQPWDITLFDGRVFAFKGSDQLSGLEFNPGITAFRPTNGYNAPTYEREASKMDPEEDICTDWKLSTIIIPSQSEDFQVCMTFVSFADRFRAEFNGNGLVRLLYQPRGLNPDDPKAWTVWGESNIGAFSAGKGREVSLSVVDFRAMLWIDGKPLLQSTDEQYDHGYQKATDRSTLRERIQYNENLIADLQAQSSLDAKKRLADVKAKQAKLLQQWDWFQKPAVQIAALGKSIELWHTKLQRDVYYTSPILQTSEAIAEDLSGGRYHIDVSGRQFDYLKDMLKNPSEPGGVNSWKKNDYGRFLAWGVTGNPIHLRENENDHDLDEYFCLGDNSPLSHDGRAWEGAAPSLRLYDKDGNFQYQLGTVPRYNILGRALFVYWPAGYQLPIVNWPLVPNVGRMRLIK